MNKEKKASPKSEEKSITILDPGIDTKDGLEVQKCCDASVKPVR